MGEMYPPDLRTLLGHARDVAFFLNYPKAGAINNDHLLYAVAMTDPGFLRSCGGDKIVKTSKSISWKVFLHNLKYRTPTEIPLGIEAQETVAIALQDRMAQDEKFARRILAAIMRPEKTPEFKTTSDAVITMSEPSIEERQEEASPIEQKTQQSEEDVPTRFPTSMRPIEEEKLPESKQKEFVPSSDLSQIPAISEADMALMTSPEPEAPPAADETTSKLEPRVFHEKPEANQQEISADTNGRQQFFDETPGEKPKITLEPLDPAAAADRRKLMFVSNSPSKAEASAPANNFAHNAIDEDDLLISFFRKQGTRPSEKLAPSITANQISEEPKKAEPKKRSFGQFFSP